MISAYDLKESNQKVSDHELLQLANDLLSWLAINKYLEGDILNLNMLQVIKRQRSLNNEEKNLLCTILDNSKDNSVKCGASILLGNKDQITFYFDKLSEQQKLQFKNYPIYNLVEK